MIRNRNWWSVLRVYHRWKGRYSSSEKRVGKGGQSCNFSTPAKPDSCPFGDCAFCLLLIFLDDRGNLLLGVSKNPMSCEVRPNGLLLFFCVGWKSRMFGILALQEARNGDLVLVGAFAGAL